MSRAHLAGLLARRRVAAIDYNRDWPFALEARADFGPWATNSDGTSRATATRWDSSGQLVAAAQYSKRITYDPVTLECRGLVVEAAAASDTLASTGLNVAVTAPVSRTVTADPYVVSFTGTGSVTLSGVATGTISGTGADRQAIQLITPSAGSLTLTSSGQVRNLDLVQTKAHGQPIVGTTVRSVESYQISGSGFTNAWPGNAGYIYFEWWDKSLSISNHDGTELFAAILNNTIADSVVAYYNANTGQINYWAYYGSALRVIATTTNTINLRGKNKLVIAWGASIGAYIVLNGGAATTWAWPGAWPQPNQFRMGNSTVSGSNCMADVARVTFGTTPPSIAAAQAMTA